MDIFQILFYQPTFNLMVFFMDVFGNIGWAIIAIALISKIITIPLTKKQIKNAEQSTVLQAKMKELRKKYKHNEQKLAEEMAKLQAAAIPGQLGGCLSIIIFIILFIQVRSVILDLVNQVYHAFNKVGYTFVGPKKEDYIKLDLPEGFSAGENSLVFEIATDNGNQLNKTYDFVITTDKEQQIELIKESELALTEGQRTDARNLMLEKETKERAQDFGVYNPDFDKSLVNIPLTQFLFFTTDSTHAYVLTDNTPDTTFYLRAPSGQMLDYGTLKVSLNEEDITAKAEYQQGDKLNLNFAGINMSRVASDFGLFNLAITLPYILLSLFSGLTQFFVTKLYSANTEAAAPIADTKDKKKTDDEEPDFAATMAQSMKQMNLIFPIMTIMMSLGYLGGASFIPMGVTLFWTGQNSFVIIQQMITQRKKVIAKVNAFWQSVQVKFKK